MAKRNVKLKGPKKSKRRQNNRKTRDVFLVVCEGEKTEPYYFREFRAPNKVVIGKGYNTVSLVELAMKEREGHKRGPFDQVWAVFDKDIFSDEQFNRALELAENENIRVAYSIEAFEIWYLLHFQYFDSAMSRKQYSDKLDREMDKLPGSIGKYAKARSDMYEILEPYMNTAINNAEKLLAHHGNKKPAEKNPSTTVHLLVNELLVNSPDAHL
jgi:hypothetical protein